MGLFSSETESESQVDPMRRDQTVGWQNRYFGLLDRPFEFFPDQTYADMTPEQLAALEGRMGVAEGLGGGIMDPTAEAWGSMLTAPDVASNPYVNAMLDVQGQQAMENLREDIMPMITSHAIGAGGMGGSRQGVAQRGAIEDTMDALTQARAQTQLGAYGQGLQQQQYGVGAAPGMVNLQLMPSDIMMGVGEARRAEEQLGINEAMARHEFAQEEPWRRMERFVSPYQTMSSPYTTSKATQKTTPSGLQIAGQVGGAMLTGGMGLGAMGLGPMAGMFSGAGGAAAGAAGAGAGGGIMNAAIPLAMNTATQNMSVPGSWGRGGFGYTPMSMYGSQTVR